MRLPVASTLALIVAVPLIAAAGAQPQRESAGSWAGCCGLTPWPQAGPRPPPHISSGPFGGYGYIPKGNALRHTLGLTSQVPAPYANLKNPLPPTPQNAQAGSAIYEAQCASCHGTTGLADAPRSRTLNPPPAQLGWLTTLPPNKRDGFMYWSVADGGAQFSTDMPSYKGKLTDEQMWAVIGYIQARLPAPTKAPG